MLILSGAQASPLGGREGAGRDGAGLDGTVGGGRAGIGGPLSGIDSE